LFVADTNNHRVVWADLASGGWREIAVEGLAPPARPDHEAAAAEAAPPVTLRREGGATLLVDGGLPPDAHPNPEAPLTLRVSAHGRALFQVTRTTDRFPVEFVLPPAALEPGAWLVELSFAFCTEGDQAMCVPVQRAWRVTVAVADGGASRLELRAAPAQSAGREAG
jgi:hypothetical protein